MEGGGFELRNKSTEAPSLQQPKNIHLHTYHYEGDLRLHTFGNKMTRLKHDQLFELFKVIIIFPKTSWSN